MDVKEMLSVISFRVGQEELLAFKKYQLLLKINENMNTQEVFLFLLKNTQEKLEKENEFQSHKQELGFIEKFTATGKKNLRILYPKKIQINITEQHKELFYDVAYSLIKRNNSQEWSYPYIFKQILKINEDIIL